METTPHGSLGRRELALALAAAAAGRLYGLGHVSLWLDEILSALRVALPLPEAWEAWRGNPVHPPLSELLQWLWFRAVDSEPARRLLPIAFGVATVALLARLADRWFGRGAAIASAWIAALSPLHVRYSQELRAYSLGLLALVVALAVHERVLERGGWGRWAALGASLSLCYWSLYTAAVALVPIVWITLETGAGRERRGRSLAGLALALGLSILLFSPWLPVVGDAAGKVHEERATAWTLELAAARWQFLTVGGLEGAAPSIGAAVFAGAAAVGLALALGVPRGRAVVAGALAGSVGIEAALKLADHWSNGRYNLAAWPFLVILAGLGCAAVSRVLSRLWRASGGARSARARAAGAAVAALPLAMLLVSEAAGLADYYRVGRPDWRRVARAVSEMAAPDRPIRVSNEWTRVALGYYLGLEETPRRAAISARPEVVDAGSRPQDLAGRGCTVIVDAREPRSPAVEALLLETPAQCAFPRSGARVAAVAAADAPAAADDPWRCLPLEVEQAAGERPAPWPLRRTAPSALELTAGDQPRLRFGWSYPERTSAGMTYRWAVGRWAAVDLEGRAAGTLRLVAWSLADGQTLSVYRRRRLLARLPVSTVPETLDVALPGDFGSYPTETLVFELSRYASPQENPRPLSVGFDSIALLP